jgi:uncharacterized protein YajQ (UPF0234 family)
MKKHFLISLVVLLISSFSLFAQFSGGNGTENNPYQITSREDLKALADSVNLNRDTIKLNVRQDTAIEVLYTIIRDTFSLRSVILNTTHTTLSDTVVPFVNWSKGKYLKLMNDID